MIRVFAITVLCLLICACAQTKQTAFEPPADCQELFVILPGNYIIDLAAGSNITLNPAVQEFALFCSPQKAQAALQKAIKDKELPDTADWRVYKLNGGPELIVPCNSDNLCLGQSASVADWINENNAF